MSRYFLCCIGLLCLLVILPIPASAQSQPEAATALNLQQVLSAVETTNPELAAQRLMEFETQQAARAAGPFPNPTFSFGMLNYPADFKPMPMPEPMQMREYSISQMVPIGMRPGLERRAARYEALSQGYEVQMLRRELAARAQAAFVELWIDRQAVEIVQQQRGLLDQVVQAAQARVAANLSGQSDLLAAISERDRMQAMLLELQAAESGAGFRLNLVMGRDPNEPIDALEPPLELIQASFPDWREDALNANPGVRSMEALQQSGRTMRRAAQWMYLPNLMLSASYGDRDEYDDMVSGMVGLELPLFDLGRRRAVVDKSGAMVERYERMRAAELLRLRSSLADLEARHARSRERLELYQGSLIPTAEQAYSSTLADYTVGRVGLQQVLMAAMSLGEQRRGRLMAQMDCAMAQIDARMILSPLSGE